MVSSWSDSSHRNHKLRLRNPSTRLTSYTPGMGTLAREKLAQYPFFFMAKNTELAHPTFSDPLKCTMFAHGPDRLSWGGITSLGSRISARVLTGFSRCGGRGGDWRHARAPCGRRVPPSPAANGSRSPSPTDVVFARGAAYPSGWIPSWLRVARPTRYRSTISLFVQARLAFKEEGMGDFLLPFCVLCLRNKFLKKIG